MSTASGTHQGTTLVLGGTGKTGRRVVGRLAALGAPVRVGSRAGTPAFDWDDRGTWPAALRDVEAVYLTYYPDLGLPGAVEAVQSFVDLAREHSVRRLVLLSGRGEDEAERAEQVVQRSGAEWTILRASWFAQNFSESYLLDAVVAGEVVLPVGDVGEPFIDVEDIADIAVAALTDDGHVGQLYELTGPRLLTFAGAVEEIARAIGRDVRYVQVSPEEYRSALAEAAVPAEFAWLLNYLFTTVLDGRSARVTDGVRRALGREPRDFSDYVRAAAAAGAWDASPPLLAGKAA
jgi:uncharacterized protein YbjT (DUF2867 family)